MIESTREPDNCDTVVLVHPLGRRLAATLPSTAIEVSSVLDAIGFVARGTREHHVTAVVVGGDELRRFPDAATAIKRLDQRVRVIEVETPADPASGQVAPILAMTSDVDARLDDADAPAMVPAAVSGRLQGDHASMPPAAALAPAPASAEPPSAAAVPAPAPAPAPAPDDATATTPRLQDREPQHPADVVDAQERAALTASLLDETVPGTPATDGSADRVAARLGMVSGEPKATDEASETAETAEIDATAWPIVAEPGPAPAAAERDRAESPTPTGAAVPAERVLDGPPPLSFAEAVRAREEAFEPVVDDGGDSLGDIDLVEAVLAGEGRIGRVAIRLMREQTGWRDLEFLDRVHGDPAADSAGGAAAAPATAPVEDDGRRFGVLRSRIARPEELSLWAGWLARWLELGRRHELFQSQARTDELTGALNRRGMFEFLDTELAAARERRRPVTVMAFDIDDFKQFNDRFGHEAGDVILQETVALLRSVTRRTDQVCRVGGDEFAVVFSDPDGPRVAGSSMPHDVEVIARRFQQQVQTMRFPRLGIDAPGQLSFSAGLASFPWDASDAAGLLRVADQRALESKRRGKNHVTLGPGVHFTTDEACASPDPGSP